MLYLQYGHKLPQCYTTAPRVVWVQFRIAPPLQLAKKPIGLALDTRIRNLFGEHGLYSWYFSCCDRAGAKTIRYASRFWHLICSYSERTDAVVWCLVFSTRKSAASASQHLS